MELPNEENKRPQKHIANIFKEYTKPSRLLRSFTNLSNTVIQTALSGQSKFVFELLQNADDAFEDQRQSIEVEFIVQDEYLIVQHNGKGFDYNDVERICDYASQIEEVKATDLSKTGYKGLGFKSLFNLSDSIYVYSNGYSFRFDKTFWPDSESKPWQIIPIWCRYDELPLNQIYQYDQPVNFILRVNNDSQIISQLRELIDQPELILYLHRIDKLNVNFNEEKHFLERRVNRFGVFNRIDFYKNMDLESTWLSRTYKRSVPLEVQAFIQGGSRFIYPDKIKRAKEVTFTFSLRSDNSLTAISKIAGLCYSTLPTQLHLTLPYHINSFFILNLDRTQLHENEWNEFLMRQMGYLQFNLLKDLAEVSYLKNYVIELFVREIDHPYGKFIKAFLKGFMIARSEIGWLPAHQGTRLLKLGEVWTDEIEFFKQNFQNIRDHRIHPYVINYDVRCQYYLSTSEGEAKHFTFDQLFRDFPNKYYPQLTKSAYVNFINFLYKKVKGPPTDNKATTRLKNVTFLKAKDGTLLSPKNALLEESENPIPDCLMLNPIDNEYLPLSNTDLIKEWLTILGARRLTHAQVLRESVLKWIDSGNLDRKITIQNHIEIINYLVKGFEQLTNKEIEKLKERLLILTEKNRFNLAKLCYLPDAVSIHELSDIISEDEKISSSYDMNNLRWFFIRVGVCNKLNPIDVFRKSILMWINNNEIRQQITKSNYKPIIEYAASHYPMLEHKLTEFEKMELKKMLVLTCGEILQKAQVCYLDIAVPNVKGLENVIAMDKLVSTKNNTESVCDFLAKIGVSQSIPPVDVMRRSILKWIHEGDINKRITQDNHQEILKYMGEQWSILDNSPGLKPKEKQLLQRMPILTESGVFRAACSCYWSISSSHGNYSEEIPGLKSVISADEFVSSSYHLKVIKMLLEELCVRVLKFTDIYEKYSDHLMHRENLKWFFSQLVNYWKRSKANNDQLLNCLQHKLRASSCLLAKNGKLYPSTELYSSQFDNIDDIDRNAIILLEYEKLPEDLEIYLGFKTHLDFKCIKQLLKGIGKSTKIGKDKTKLFFTILLEQLRQKDKNEIKKNQLSLLSEETKLMPAKDLYYFIEKDATCALTSCYLKRICGMSHEDTLELANLCGVNSLPFSQEVKREKEIYDNTLKEFYLERLSFIAIQESKELNEDVIVTLRNLYGTICNIKLYQCQNIHVKYPFGDFTKIKEHFDHLTLHVVGKWFKRKSKIHEYLRKAIGIEADIRDIIDMEPPITQDDKQEWLSYQKEDSHKLDFVEEELKKLLSNKDELKLYILHPDESLNSQPCHSDCEDDLSEDDLNTDEGRAVCDTVVDEPKAITRNEKTTILVIGEGTIEVDTRRLVPNEFEIIDLKNRMQPELPDSNHSSTENLYPGSCTFPQEVNSEQSCIKWLSEEYVFTFLQDHYKNKYPNSLCNLSDGIFTLMWQSHEIEVVWLNASGEKGELYDILLKKEGEVKLLIEVISTNDGAANDSFNISHRKCIRKIGQLAAELPDHQNKYCIFRVLNANNSSTQSVKELSKSAALYKIVPLIKNL